MIFTVKYQAGDYSGTRKVNADSSDDAIQIVKSRIRKEMSLPMYSDSYEVVGVEDEHDD